MRFFSFFAGVGGFDIGLERAKMRCVGQCENNQFCVKVLEKHWPNVWRCGDIGFVTAKEIYEHCGNVDAFCLGFPCQDISIAGDRGGMDAARSGLWSQFVRILRESLCYFPRPLLIVENVAALLIPDKRYPAPIGRVLGDLATLGFDAEWEVLSARDAGAPHLRERVIIVAHDREKRIERVFQGPISRFPEFSWCENVRGVEDLRSRPDIPDALFRGTRDGIPDWSYRVAACGNAVVPAVAQWVGERIMSVHKK